MKSEKIGVEVVDCTPTSEQIEWGKAYLASRAKQRAIMVKAYRRTHRFRVMPITRDAIWEA